MRRFSSLLSIALLMMLALTAGPSLAQPSDAGRYDAWDMGDKWGEAWMDQAAGYPPSRYYVEELVSLAAFGPQASAPSDDDNGDERKLEDIPKLTVRGEAELEKPADRLRLSVGVVTEHADVAEALGENNAKMDAVVKAIKRLGLTEDEYQTGRFRIRPQYERRPLQPPPDWKRRIEGYEVTNSIAIKTTKLDLAGELIAAANEAGANSVNVDGFDLADPRQYREEAIREATKNAIADATALADAASLTLVRIVAVSLDHTPPRMQEMRYSAARTGADGGGGAPPISPGDVTVTATVTIVWEIAPREGGE